MGRARHEWRLDFVRGLTWALVGGLLGCGDLSRSEVGSVDQGERRDGHSNAHDRGGVARDAERPTADGGGAREDARLTDAVPPLTDAVPPLTDAVPPLTDAVPPLTDGQVAPMDGQARVDAAVGGPDVTVPPVDGQSVPVPDAPIAPVADAAPPPDAGAPPPDAAVGPVGDTSVVPPLDAVAPPLDAVAPPLDAGVVQDECTVCHGGVDGPAPPRALSGAIDPSAVAVGAHQTHLRGGALRGPIACDDCHVVPGAIWEPGHIDGVPAELNFGPFASTDGAEPQWNHAAATCAGAYCHGATLSGGTNTTPVWTQVDGSQITCDSCHGAPPPLPHPQPPAADACAQCHPGTVLPDGTLDLRGGLHINGTLEVEGGALACDGCHGSDGEPAPPRALSGAIDPGTPGVGAHRQHLTAGHVRREPIPCAECHQVPATADAPGHRDATPGAELTFGVLATTGGLAPAYDRASNRCANVYCHGASLTGGSLPQPQWTNVDGSQRACGTCHGAPPPAPHPQGAECTLCHPGTVLPNGALDLAGDLHLNGRLDVRAGGCDACHGSAGNPAPPRALDGSVDPSSAGVGAHREHLEGGLIRGPLECDQCHRVPGTLEAPTHLDGEPGAEVTFGALAERARAAPVYDAATTTCAGTYCHGATLSGGTVDAPDWTRVDGTQIACDSCHGAPPPAPHPNAEACSLCHPGTVLPDGTIDRVGGLHIDGQLQVQAAGCDGCHGGQGNPAPPADLAGNQDTASPGVGAHRAHLEGNHLRAPIACGECHPVPAAVGEATHLDASPGVTVQFGALARTGGLTPRFNAAQHSCSGNYCHGITLTGGQRRSPVWNRVDGTYRACTACHGAPPPAPHPARQDCQACHPTTVRPDGTLDVVGGHHLDGRLDLAELACDTCHGGQGDPAPPAALDGATLSSEPGVGAHDAHLRGGSIRGPVDCEACHLVPATLAEAGHLDATPGAELVFGVLATSDGATPAYDPARFSCDNVYCHGATLAGGNERSPVWTSGAADPADCGRCHGAPPPAPHPVNDDCHACHPGTVRADTSIDVVGGLHIDGQVQAQIPGCDGCHGSAGQAAPPRALDGAVATASLGVGAHRAHLSAGALRGPMPCNACHTVPADVRAAGHLDASPLPEVTFSGLARADGAAPSWNRVTATCSGVYCHGATRPGGRDTTPIWTRVDGSQSACGSCHGVPPPAPHVASPECDLCHSRTVRADGRIDVASGTHINGQVDVQMPACGGCHGSPGEPGPPAGLDGVVDTADPGVGAHEPHLAGGAFSGPIACTECHVVPATLEAIGHLDAIAGAEVVFGRLARTGPSVARYDSVTNQCSNVYCHGATLGGGSVPQPRWTRVDGTQAPCGGCHGAPPPAPHSQSPACWRCHPGTVLGTGDIDLAGGLHVNGVVEAVAGHPEGWSNRDQHGAAFDAGGAGACGACHGADLRGGELGVSCEQCHPGWRSNCTFCHGGRDNPTGAPPDSVAGGSARALPGVGSHTKHVAATTLHSAWGCAKCHTTPADALSIGHIDGDGRAEVRMESRNAAAVYSLQATTCTSTYCHGDGVSPSGAITWTQGGPYTCSACHDDRTVPANSNTLRGQHRLHILNEGYNCVECHRTVANAANAIIAPALHVNESVQVSFLAAGFSYANGRCTGTCHGEQHSGERW